MDSFHLFAQDPSTVFHRREASDITDYDTDRIINLAAPISFLRGREQFTSQSDFGRLRHTEIAQDNSLRVWRHNCTIPGALT